MSHNRVWPLRAAKSAAVGSGEPAEKIQVISSAEVTIPLHMDGIDSFSLLTRTSVIRRLRDSATIVQYLMCVTCRDCKEAVYEVERPGLEDMSAARSTAQFHMAECPTTENTSAETATVSPMRRSDPAVTEPELPQH